MRRREFIKLLGGAAAGWWPFVAQGQETGRIYRLGALLTSPRDAPHYVALFDELRRLGFIEGKNLVIDAAGFGLPPERMEMHAADLMNGSVDVIFAAGRCSSSRRSARDDQHSNSGIHRRYGWPRICALPVQTRG